MYQAGVVLEVDTIVMPEDNQGNRYMMVFTDPTTFHTWLAATREKSAKEAAEALLQRYASFGIPEIFRHDNGGEFTNELVGELHKRLETEDKPTTPHHFQGHSHVERRNREVLNNIRMAIEETRQRQEWSKFVWIIQAIVNNTVREATGMTANMLVLNPIYADRMGSYVSRFCYQEKEAEFNREHEEPSPQTRENTTNTHDEMAGVARQILESVTTQQC
jgi:hypothetical protein